MFAGIRKLAPAERMTVRADGDIRSEIYWTPMASPAADELADGDEDELGERLLELLRASIAKRMMSDVPFGVFLSGGVDSSTNVALMSELMSEPVRTFSVAFHEHERYNELEYARQIARRFGTDHHEVVIDASDLVTFLPDMVHHQDEPIADWVCVPLYYVSKLARESGTIVVQVGEGSDELFHGYQPLHRRGRRRRRYWEPFHRMPGPVRQAPRRLGGRARAAHGSRDTACPVHRRCGRRTAAVLGRRDLLHGRAKARVLAANGDRPDAYAWSAACGKRRSTTARSADLLQKMTYWSSSSGWPSCC